MYQPSFVDVQADCEEGRPVLLSIPDRAVAENTPAPVATPPCFVLNCAAAQKSWMMCPGTVRQDLIILKKQPR